MKCLFHLFLICTVLGRATAAELRAGAAVVNITPEQPAPMAGYYSMRLSQGTHDDLFARALVIESGGVRAALVVCDLITMPRAVVEQAREIVARESGIPAGHVMISATHTHTGPVLFSGSARAALDGNDSDVVRRYTGGLPAKIAAAVRMAEQRIVPARLSAASESEPALGHNRRFWMKDGSVGWNPGKLNPAIVKPAGPVDPEVAVLHVETAQSNALAAYVNFAMHPDTVGGLLFSADYVFALSRALADWRGSNFVTLFANGACGNINHIDVNWREPQKGHAEAARLGTILAGDVFKALTHLRPAGDGPLRARSELVPLALAPLLPGDLERASNIVARIGTKNAPKFLEQVFAFKALDVAARDGRPWDVEVQVIALGDDVAWVSLPGEVFVELGLEIKKKSPFKHTFIAELANGAIGYIPDARAYDQGNYEPISARCAKGSGEKLSAAAIRLLRELK
jgi:hypothetical protein